MQHRQRYHMVLITNGKPENTDLPYSNICNLTRVSIPRLCVTADVAAHQIGLKRASYETKIHPTATCTTTCCENISAVIPVVAAADVRPAPVRLPAAPGWLGCCRGSCRVGRQGTQTCCKAAGRVVCQCAHTSAGQGSCMVVARNLCLDMYATVVQATTPHHSLGFQLPLHLCQISTKIAPLEEA